MTRKEITIPLRGSITTGFNGIQKLFDFFHYAKNFNNQDVVIDFKELNWFDANLSALFGAITNKLRKENDIIFYGNTDYIENNFGVLFRNGFFGDNIDNRESTIKYKMFSPTDKDGFYNYIVNDLSRHRAFPEEKKDEIIDNLFEVFCNIQTHSKTEEDFFVCGQYYPQKKYIIFTLVDVGVGFLPAIQNKDISIKRNSEAIKWALKEHNTTSDIGGLGLFNLHNYFHRDKNGIIQIITGNAYWASNISQTNWQDNCYNIRNTFPGSIINLFFYCK